MKRKRKSILKFIPLTLMLIVIFVFSQMPGDESGETSGKLLEIVEKVYEGLVNRSLTLDAKESLHWLLRKAAHFCEFGLLGLTALYAFRDFFVPLKKNFKLCLYSELIVIISAALDELHQYFIPGRYMALLDVFIDSSGGLLAILTVFFLFIKKRQK